MVNRCRICGAPVSHVTVCNHCRTVREERRFLKMVSREELREARTIGQTGNSDLPPKGVA